jgi:hypothetical protein
MTIAPETMPAIVRRPRMVAALLLGLAVPSLTWANLVLGRFVVAGDPQATARKVMESETLFRLASVGVVVVLTASLFVLMQFYWLLRPVGKNLAALMVILYLAGACIALSNELYRLSLPTLLDQASTAASVSRVASVSVSLHSTGALIAGLFWGLWLIPYGYLVFRSGFFPRFIGVLLFVECLAFLVQSIGSLLVPAAATQLEVLPAVTTLVELLVPIWLLIKGRQVTLWWEGRALRVPLDPTRLAGQPSS